MQAGGLAVVDLDGARERFDGHFHNGETEARAAGVARASGVHAIEAVEKMRKMLGRHADAVVVESETVEIVVFVDIFQRA